MVGNRIDIYELVDPEMACSGYGLSWLPLSAFKNGEQTREFYYCKEGYCSWNMHIGISEYAFKRAYKKVGTMVVKELKRTKLTNGHLLGMDPMTPYKLLNYY